jgi:hypothetical protein
MFLEEEEELSESTHVLKALIWNEDSAFALSRSKRVCVKEREKRINNPWIMKLMVCRRGLVFFTIYGLKLD